MNNHDDIQVSLRLFPLVLHWQARMVADPRWQQLELLSFHLFEGLATADALRIQSIQERAASHNSLVTVLEVTCPFNYP